MDVSGLIDEASSGRLCLDLLHHIDQRRDDGPRNSSVRTARSTAGPIRKHGSAVLDACPKVAS